MTIVDSSHGKAHHQFLANAKHAFAQHDLASAQTCLDEFVAGKSKNCSKTKEGRQLQAEIDDFIGSDSSPLVSGLQTPVNRTTSTVSNSPLSTFSAVTVKLAPARKAGKQPTIGAFADSFGAFGFQTRGGLKLWVMAEGSYGQRRCEEDIYPGINAIIRRLPPLCGKPDPIIMAIGCMVGHSKDRAFPAVMAVRHDPLYIWERKGYERFRKWANVHDFEFLVCRPGW